MVWLVKYGTNEVEITVAIDRVKNNVLSLSKSKMEFELDLVIMKNNLQGNVLKRN